MASIYKREQDRGKKRAVWYIGYTDHTGARRTAKGFRDRGDTEQLAATMEREAMLRKRGLIDPAIERAAERRNVPLEQHLKAFEESLASNSPKYIKLLMTRVRRIVAGCAFETVSQMEVEPVEAFLRELSEKEDLGNRTYNHYVQAADAFCTWMVNSHRTPSNPLVGMERLNTAIDIRHRRRALSVQEFAQLVASARSSGISIQRFDGESRARIYIISYMTGLRRNEIASLTPT